MGWSQVRDDEMNFDRLRDGKYVKLQRGRRSRDKYIQQLAVVKGLGSKQI